MAHCKGVIGKDNKLPWHIPEELKYFKKITEGSVCLVGSKTYESIKNLPNRIMIRVDKNTSYDQAKELAKSYKKDIFIIGGGKLYLQALEDSELEQLYVSEILNLNFDGDTYFPKLDSRFKLIKSEIKNHDNVLVDYQVWKRHDEYQYLNLIDSIVKFGKGKRGTRYLLGNKMVFNLDRFPLLTTKKMFMKGVLHELLWFIRAGTNSKDLESVGVNIWKKNSTKEFLASRNIKRDEGDLGPIYGYQWRKFNADYEKKEGGFDQLAWVIKELRENPQSRQIIMTAWNPLQVDQMALPPCHVTCRFHVEEKDKLNCTLYQRSCDVGLGVPFNIASYSLLVYMIATILEMRPGKFIYLMDDCHVYDEHVEQLKEQIKREPYKFPRLEVKKRDNIDEFQYDDFKLVEYQSHDSIKMEMLIK